MIEPYQAIGLVPTMRGIRHSDEIGVNLEHIAHLVKAASWLSSLDHGRFASSPFQKEPLQGLQ